MFSNSFAESVRQAAHVIEAEASARSFNSTQLSDTTAGWRRQRLIILLVEMDGVIHSYTQLLENRLLVIGVGPAVKQSRTTADETVVLV
jgi:hypothetical protein